MDLTSSCYLFFVPRSIAVAAVCECGSCEVLSGVLVETEEARLQSLLLTLSFIKLVGLVGKPIFFQMLLYVHLELVMQRQ